MNMLWMENYEDKDLEEYHKNTPKKIFPVHIGLRVIHIHIPKTAGTSIRSALFGSAVIKHVTAQEVNEYFWEKFLSFSVIRHPVERLYSNYKYHCKTPYKGALKKSNPDLSDLSFDAYCERFLFEGQILMAPQVSYLSRNGSSKKFVDHLIRFEDMASGLSELESKIGQKLNLPHLKSSPSIEIQPGPDIKTLIEKFYAEDFEKLGY